jgi:hypothetical protein
MLVFLSMMEQRFACDDRMCTIDGKRAFARADLRGVHTETRRSGKSTNGIVVLELANGSTRELMSVEPDDAEEAAQEIRSQMTAGGRIDVLLHGPRFLFVVGVIMLLGAITCIALALARMGRVDMIVSSDGNFLHVRRSLFAVPLGSHDVPLRRVDRVVIERERIPYMMRGRFEGPVMGARLKLVYRDRSDSEQPLTRSYFPGNALHYRAAGALRAALRLSPDEQDDATLAAIPMRTTAMGMRLGAAWAGMTTGSLLGLALFGLTLLATGQMNPRANIEGWMVAAGAIPGAIAGIAIVFHATRPRLPR